MCTTNLISSLILGVFLLTAPMMAQRPSYAGPRPTGGLSQKEKYHTQQQTVQSPAGGVNNRFGAADSNQSVPSNNIPYGAPQRPPVGYPIVAPQAQYVPLNGNGNQQPQFALDNRISGNDIGGGNGSNAPAGNGIFSSAGAAANANAAGNFNPLNFAPQPQGFQNLPPPPPVAGLPLDAHGDQALIDYLNTVPLDQRPFWFLNYQAIEAQRNSTRPAFTGAVSSRGSFFG